MSAVARTPEGLLPARSGIAEVIPFYVPACHNVEAHRCVKPPRLRGRVLSFPDGVLLDALAWHVDSDGNVAT
jgi:hypothetical protein